MVRPLQDGAEPAVKKKKKTADGVSRTGGTWAEKYGKKIIAWDVAPEEEYWEQLFRVSRNQVIWGGNYFWLPPTRCFLVWEKLSISESFSMAMCEYAWTSFDGNSKLFKHAPQGDKKDKRFHPCLPAGTLVRFNGMWKPIELVCVGDENEFGVVSNISIHKADELVSIATETNTVIATWNHPFLVKRNNTVSWVNAELVKEGDELLTLISSTPSQKKGILGIGLTGKGSEWNTALCGRNISARFQAVCKSITRTLTRRITIFPICNLSLPLNTSGCTKVADLKTVFGINLAKPVASIKLSHPIIGTSTKKQGGLPHRIASLVTSKRFAKNAVCVSQKVGSVNRLRKSTIVYNLTIDGIPAFETTCGITHNTAKPIDLYKWVYKLFAKPGDTILDTHLGSGSSRIAAWDMGLDFVGYEIDPHYFELEEKRFQDHTAQMDLVVEMGLDLTGDNNAH